MKKKVREMLGESRKLFVEAGSLILQQRIYEATGGEACAKPLDNAKCDADLHDDILKEFIPMITSHKVDELTAESTADVISMLKRGDISISEAKDLMSMLSIQSDIEDIKQLLAKVQQLTGDGNTYHG